MKIDIIDINKLVKVNDIPRVSNPIFLTSERQPTPDGLFSYEIFGTPGSKKRNNQFAYIDLNKPFFHPLVFYTLKAVQKNIIDCMAGITPLKLTKEGTLEKSEDGEVGIDYLYKIWDKIKFKKQTGNFSEIRVNRLGFLRSLKKEELFITKQLVIPAFYRDINWAKAQSGVIEKDEINDVYMKLLSYTESRIDKELSIELSSPQTDFKIQLLVNEIYEKLVVEKLPKKTGMIKKFLMGKTVDYSVRLVISVRDMSKDSPVDYEHVGIPLPYLCVLFFPYLLNLLITDLTVELENVSSMTVIEGDKLVSIDVHEDAFLDFLPKELEKRIKLFIRDKHSRNEPIKIKGKNGKYHTLPFKNFKSLYLKSDELEPRHICWFDYLYQLMLKVIEDKHVIITRYPLDSAYNLFPSKIAVLTTDETRKEINAISDKVMEYYPVYKEHMEWLDTCVFAQSYLSGLGADFDGDTVSVRAVYTAEANAEADKFIKSPKFLLNSSGGTIRTLKNEGILGLYSLTKE